MEEKYYYIYILMNKWNTTSYIGVTNSLSERVWQHKEKIVKGFTEKYNLNKLVYYEIFENVVEAISREKQLKRWSRKKKVDLIRKLNSDFKDLSDDL
ncbi:GIY-YIG nuclease family protein [Candidatus Falkowbacteria bacterium]|nr:GIY-YIG nuclease family protein [Candidatus Falkowbacteria bacterium]